MFVVYGVVAVMFAVFAVSNFRLAWRQWRGGFLPESRPPLFTLYDAESRAGNSRGSLAMGFLSAFFAILGADAAIFGLHPQKESASAWIGTVCVLGVLVSTFLFFGILNFNRPRFLVPPCRREELGAIAGRRRRRREHLPML